MGSGYENRLPPEGINISSEHPLKEFSSLILAGLGIVAFIVVSLTLLAGWLAQKVPFSYEQAIVDRFSEQFSDLSVIEDDTSDSTLVQKRQAYLDQLTQQYLQSHPLPDDISVHVHYVDDEVVNAFATLGGNIFIHRGLFDVMESENALAFVLGHEIAHVAERHPVTAMGRGVVLVLALSAMLGVSDAGLPDWLVSHSSSIAILSFSRKQESVADQFALQGVQSLYGHVRGANGLFDYLQSQSESFLDIEILQTHPLHDSRIDGMNSFSKKNPQGSEGLILIPESLR